jgi:RNA polymerase sigma factor for flagellar operon FliA
MARYERLARRIARRVAYGLPPTVDRDDLEQSALIGLWEATQSSTSTTDEQFWAYAKIKIRAAIFDALREEDPLTRTQRRRTRELRDTYVRVSHRLGRPARQCEVAAEMGCDLETYFRIRDSEIGLSSLDADQSAAALTLHDWLASQAPEPAEHLATVQLDEALQQALGRLPPVERLIVKLMVEDELFEREVGALLGVSASRVSQYFKRAVARLQTWMHAHGAASTQVLDVLACAD